MQVGQQVAMSNMMKADINQPRNSATATIAQNQKKRCDHCEKADAHSYCRADGAFLCQICDDTIHSANKLAQRHERISVAEAIAEGLGDQGDLSNSEGSQTQVPSKQLPIKATNSDSDDMNKKPGDDMMCKIGDNQKNLGASRNAGCNATNPMNTNSVAPKAYTSQTGGAPYFVPKEECAETGNGSGSSAEAQTGDVSITPPIYNQPVQQSFPPPLGVRRNMSMDDVSNFRASPNAIQRPGMPHSNTTISSSVPEYASSGFMSAGHSAMMTSAIYNSSHLAFTAHPKLKHCLGQPMSEQRLSKVYRYKQKRQARLVAETSGHKKIRYACRKTLADSRPRVKGRFAKVNTANPSASIETTERNRPSRPTKPAKTSDKFSNISQDGSQASLVTNTMSSFPIPPLQILGHDSSKGNTSQISGPSAVDQVSVKDQNRSDELFFVSELADMVSDDQKLDEELESGFAAESDDVFHDFFGPDLGVDDMGMSKAAMRRVMSSPAFLDLGDVVL